MDEAKVPSVLIVDDDAFVRVYLRDALAGTGYRLSEACNGEEAVAKVVSERPEVVLLDLLMPKQSGLEALLKIRELHPRAQVVVISSMDTEGLIQQALSAGAHGFVSKPFHPLEIVGAVQQALQDSHQA